MKSAITIIQIWSDEVRTLVGWAAALAVIVFAMPGQLCAESVQTLYNFTHGNAGGVPYAPLTNVNGMLYGSLSLGGANYAGAIFQLDPATGAQKIVYSFAPAPQTLL